MYKDKDKQKEANRLAAQRKRDKAKGMTATEGMTRITPDNSHTQQDTTSPDAPGSMKSEETITKGQAKSDQDWKSPVRQPPPTDETDKLKVIMSNRTQSAGEEYLSTGKLPDSKFAKCVTRDHTEPPYTLSNTGKKTYLDHPYHKDCLCSQCRDTSGQSKRTRTTGCKVAIPGDEDYVGVCEKVDGTWTVKKAEQRIFEHLNRTDLEQAIKAYPNAWWVNSPEHKELLHRLNTRSVAELEAEGYHVPAWKRTA